MHKVQVIFFMAIFLRGNNILIPVIIHRNLFASFLFVALYFNNTYMKNYREGLISMTFLTCEITRKRKS